VFDPTARVDYTLMYVGLQADVVMAHIHFAQEAVNGPIVVWLYPSTTAGVTAPLGGGRIQGVIAQGTIGADNLTGPLAGHALADLIDAMRTGKAYVNLHTNDGVAPTDTGPGDFPGGEIRADISATD
jgi:hypothetical protein